MNILERNVEVVMERDSLEGLPCWPLPVEYTGHWYHPGDEQKWVAIHLEAERHLKISDELYRNEFGVDPVPLGQRQLFLLDRMQRPIATATAWWDDDYHGLRYGRVHWVAMLPQCQGRGLAKPLLGLVLARLGELGHQRAYLRTSTARVPAINLYLKAGFRPAVCTPQDDQAWSELGKHLKYPTQ